jgi:hypothetical protein
MSFFNDITLPLTESTHFHSIHSALNLAIGMGSGDMENQGMTHPIS